MTEDRRPEMYYDEPRADLLTLVPPGCQRVLDIGCGAGSFGRALAEREPGLHATGIELMPGPAARAAERYERVLVGPLQERLEELSGEEPYDLVVLADILEHTAEPGQVLRRVAELIGPGGRVLVSVPNVSHYSVLWKLITDRFDYADRGILDRGHLRFFTRRSFLAMAALAGLAPERQRRNYRLFQRRGLRYDRFVAVPLGLWFLRHLFVFQNLFLLRPERGA